jgi:hypothetical protein
VSDAAQMAAVFPTFEGINTLLANKAMVLGKSYRFSVDVRGCSDGSTDYENWSVVEIGDGVDERH